jgi:hypothetical protein
LGLSRDLAIKHIKDYSNLLDTYGPSEKLAKYLIVSRPKPVVTNGVLESQRKILKDQLSRLDGVKAFGQLLDVHPNLEARELDRPMVNHLRDLKQIYPSLEQNMFLNANR